MFDPSSAEPQLIDLMHLGRANVIGAWGVGDVMGEFEVAYTPGHASHHVSYLYRPTRRAFTGDVTGVRIGEGRVMAPTPPPDIDVEAWQASLDVIEAWRPAALSLTHFGS